MLHVFAGFRALLFHEPSPKFQSRLVMLPLDWSLNCTLNGALPEVGLALKFAVGAGGGGVLTWIVRLLLLEPPLPVIGRVSCRVSALFHVCDGCRVRRCV